MSDRYAHTRAPRRQEDVVERIIEYASNLLDLEVMVTALNREFRAKQGKTKLKIEDFTRHGLYYADYIEGIKQAAIAWHQVSLERGTNFQYFVNRIAPELVAEAVTQTRAANEVKYTIASIKDSEEAGEILSSSPTDEGRAHAREKVVH